MSNQPMLQLAFGWCAAVMAFGLVLPGAASAARAPVKVYILSGQSNMLGTGQVTSPNVRWGTEFSEMRVSIYANEADHDRDYDSLEAIETRMLGPFSGENSEEFPSGGTAVLRGTFTAPAEGVYQFSSGWNESTYGVMTVNRCEVYRKTEDGRISQRGIELNAGEKVPFRIIYLKPVRHAIGWYTRLDTPGTLATLVKRQGQFPYLLDESGDWKVRDDVWYRGVVAAAASKWLAPGCGATPSAIGPELAFGHMIGDFHDEPVLIIKAAQGNRSLGWDFLPPGSARFEIGKSVYAGYRDPLPSWTKGETPKQGGWYAGKQYDDCVKAVKNVLADFDGSFAHWAGRAYEIAGFVWFQGHKDAGNDVHTRRYEQNLAALIKALRRDFDAPNAPFVVAVGCGGDGRSGNALAIAEAQLAVCGSRGNDPEFRSNVITVETRDAFPKVGESPRDQGFHYHQNAGAYIRIGEAIGRGMLELIQP